MNKRKVGYQAEEAVKNYLVQQGHTIISQNYTVRGGEIDIITEKGNDRIFVEVKEVKQTKDLHNYISRKKISTLYKTIQYFNYKYHSNKNIRIDLVFTKDNNIIHYYKNISNN